MDSLSLGPFLCLFYCVFQYIFANPFCQQWSRSLDPSCILTYCINWVKTSRTYGTMSYLRVFWSNSRIIAILLRGVYNIVSNLFNPNHEGGGANSSNHYKNHKIGMQFVFLLILIIKMPKTDPPGPVMIRVKVNGKMDGANLPWPKTQGRSAPPRDD